MSLQPQPPTSGLLPPSSMALLVPKPLQLVIAEGDAEVVVEKRMVGQKRFFVHLLDEGEREDVVRRRVSSQDTHERALAELRWARATLWGDEHLQRYLYTPDWLTWPSLHELASMVDLVRSARETNAVPDYVGANSLKKALEIIRREALYPGLHPLKEESIVGPLVAFKSATGNGCAVGETLHMIGASGQHSIGNSVWVMELHTPSFTVDEVVRLPLTRHAQKECVRVLQPALATSDNMCDSWADAIKAHRINTEGRAPGLFYSIPDYILQFGEKPAQLARLMRGAAEEGRRIRLRVGVYLTLLQRNEVYVLMRLSHRTTTEGVKSEEDVHDTKGDNITTTTTTDTIADGDEAALETSFNRVTGKSYDACQAAGLLLRLAEGERLEDALPLRLLSPLASTYKCMDSVALTPSMRVTHVVVQHNPFAVIHGQRVVESFPENSEARAALSELLASREDTPQAAPPQPSRQGAVMTTTTAAAATAATPTSAALSGEQLRRGIDEAVFKILSQNPLTRVELSAHANMTRFRGLPNFDAVLRDSLRRITEYRGKKYHLKD